MNYVENKKNAEPLSKMPFNWRKDIPTHGWKILSEQPPPVGRRELTVNTKIGSLTYWRQARHGSGQGKGTGKKGDRRLSEQEKNEALAIVNRLWATDPPFSDARRGNVKDLITLILVDGDSFKAFSSCDPTDELHQFNQTLWQWTTADSANSPTE